MDSNSEIMLETLRDYILEQIKDLPGEEQRDILSELAGDLQVMAEGYGID